MIPFTPPFQLKDILSDVGVALEFVSDKAVEFVFAVSGVVT